MSIKTLSKKMLAIVVAGAMTMGLAMPTSVFAAGGDTATKTTEAYISKTFNTEVGKNEKFSFKAEQVEGNTAKVTIPDITFTDYKTGTNTERVQAVAQRVLKYKKEGHDVVVVLSLLILFDLFYNKRGMKV